MCRGLKGGALQEGWCGRALAMDVRLHMEDTFFYEMKDFNEEWRNNERKSEDLNNHLLGARCSTYNLSSGPHSLSARWGLSLPLFYRCKKLGVRESK